MTILGSLGRSNRVRTFLARSSSARKKYSELDF
jgi:hypothetical protein